MYVHFVHVLYIVIIHTNELVIKLCACKSVYMFIIQIIQELELITGRSDIKSSFLSQWTMVFVPAIISYAEHSLKKNVLSCIEKLDRAGMGCTSTLCVCS